MTLSVTNLRWWASRRGLRPIIVLLLGVIAFASFDTTAFAAGREKKARPGGPNGLVRNYKLDGEITRRRNWGGGTTSVIVTLVPGAQLPREFRAFERGNGKLDIINGVVLDLPNSFIQALEARPEIFRVHYNRPAASTNYRTSVTVGATTVRETLGYTGAGVGVAVIDSGISSWHDDLSGVQRGHNPYGDQRVTKFVDFVNQRTLPYDDNGHGTHVAGTIAGNGFDSQGQKAGIAPGASLVVLKVLDADGRGNISDIIAALNWVAVNNRAYSIKVVNLSIGAKVSESYWTDPLTLAAKKLVEKGITVVAAAGNLGRNAQGEFQYGGITAPANAPWVLTVGASTTKGTLTRSDDAVASFSSAGPTFIDFSAKPDLVAPGEGTVSLAVPGSTLYNTKPGALVDGVQQGGNKPYLALSGTSMSAPVVSGTVALMLQANPRLTPNLIKAILQYTAQQYDGYSALREGAGFLNTLGAVTLARFYANTRPGARLPVQSSWSREIHWGNQALTGGVIDPGANAWANNIMWGAATKQMYDVDNIVWGTLHDADNIVWGTMADGDNIVWGTLFDADNIVWGTLADSENIVWGTDCGGADCDEIVWGTMVDGDNIVWGTAFDSDNIVWGTLFGADNIVWGTLFDADNIVWGTLLDSDNIVWGTIADLDNIVWGTMFDSDNIVWGTNSAMDVMFDDSRVEPLPSAAEQFGDILGGN